MDPLRKALKGTPACRLEIRTPDTAKARAAAKRLQRVFDSCGFLTETTLIAPAAADGVRLESSTANADVALALQTAFHQANIEILLTVHERALQNAVVFHLGAEGYD